MAGALTIVSGNEAASLAAALTAHLVNYLLTGVIGLVALSREGETLMGVYRQLRKREEPGGSMDGEEKTLTSDTHR